MGAHLDNLQFAAENIDPWDYATSPLEAHKRAVLLRACGPRHFRAGAGARLRHRPDDTRAALEEARRRVGAWRNVTLRQALLPSGPAGIWPRQGRSADQRRRKRGIRA
jgi:hypothetical protein